MKTYRCLSHFLPPAIYVFFFPLNFLFPSIVGRAPNTKRLNLDAVGVELDRAGAIKVTELEFLAYFVVKLYLRFTTCSNCQERHGSEMCCELS